MGGKGPHGIKGVGVFEGKIRVPMALQWPAVLAARPPFTHPVISLDLMATMAVRCTSAIHVCIRYVASSTADLSTLVTHPQLGCPSTLICDTLPAHYRAMSALAACLPLPSHRLWLVSSRAGRSMVSTCSPISSALPTAHLMRAFTGGTAL